MFLYWYIYFKLEEMFHGKIPVSALRGYENIEANAVSPIPSWPMVIATSVPTSTNPPNDLNQYGALDFTLWQDIGENVHDQVHCHQLGCL